ncbi:MAG TPA: hypothetical protein VFQ40_06365, partial [Actinomycetota bacterium]|nr:hypothetical protein [Actinomycetota bacterium]
MPSDPPPPRGWPEGFGAGPDERLAIVTLSELRGLRPLHLHAAAWRLGSATACLRAVREGALGSDGDRAWLPRADPAATLAVVRRIGARLLTPADHEYEDRLHDLGDPPAGLFLLGRDLGEQVDRVAIVGARR